MSTQPSDPLFPIYIQSDAFPVSLPDADDSVIPPDDLIFDEPQEIKRMKPSKHSDNRPNGWDFIAALIVSTSGVVWLIALAVFGMVAAGWYGVKGFMGWFVGEVVRVWRSRKGVGY